MKTFFKKLFKSSADPEKLSLTVKSTLLAMVPVILVLSKQFFKLDLSEKDLMDAITAITGLVAAGGVVYGVARKIYYKFN